MIVWHAIARKTFRNTYSLNIMKNKIKLISIFSLLLITGCAALSSAEKKSEYPQQPEDIRRERAGKLFGDDGIVLFGKGKKGEEESGSSGSTGIGINSYLWRASLDTLAFMPLASADPFGGVIITDWYEDPAVKGERFKVNALILSKNLRSDAIKVTVFKQANKSGSWRDVTAKEQTARELENTILTRARELRIEKEGK